MMRLFFLLSLPLFFQACSDGDIIVTTFNFEDAKLNSCGDVGNYVFYKENTRVFESLSLKLSTSDTLYRKEGISTYPLSANTNFANYRSYDGVLGNNYFCNSIPPTYPNIQADYLAVSGTADVIVTYKYDDPLPKSSGGSNDSGLNYQSRNTLKINLQIILRDVVFVSGDKQIIQETLDMGTIENFRTIEITP
ncbi:hypothetical protein EI546_02160 [Aequorivita sp. H23M31]|uniref:DUF4270 family protein n=1 Tax=Aequorivita ciconiae TaxID=2494375 RepID=A0A410G010_9FLAO|nr:hypothetical protein [Aequorivita sp. H23M31]QAA80605.1 hypothetical protein EI546_02160 [Aequorivita sp. H23M31]